MNESIRTEKIQPNYFIQQNSLKFIRFAECKSFRNFGNFEEKSKGACKSRKISMMELLIAVNFFLSNAINHFQKKTSS